MGIMSIKEYLVIVAVISYLFSVDGFWYHFQCQLKQVVIGLPSIENGTKQGNSVKFLHTEVTIPVEIKIFSLKYY